MSIGDAFALFVLVGLALFFSRYVGRDPIGFFVDQVREGWKRIGR